MSGFAIALACKGGPNVSGILGSATGILKNVTLCVFGSRMGMSSVEYSGEPNNWPWLLTVGLRRSELIRSCRYVASEPHSHEVTTTLRSTPVGRGGLCFGNSPLAIRSVQSPKYLKGTPPSSPARRLTMRSPLGPEATRRAHASAPDSNSPTAAGTV